MSPGAAAQSGSSSGAAAWQRGGGSAGRSVRPPFTFGLRRPGALQVALGVSLLAHAALLAVRFADPSSFERMFGPAPLEVILVNTRHPDARPAEATAIAQASLAGGGEANAGRATSPLPPSAFTVNGDAPEDAERRAQAQVQPQQARPALLTAAAAGREAVALPPPAPRDADTPDADAAGASQDKQEEEKRRPQRLALPAQVERRVNEPNARPRTHYVSPATREAAYAAYVDALRRRIEARGTRDFPEAGGKKLYGELTMLVTVDADGSVLSTEIVQSSGEPALDRRAQAIVRGAGSFGPFSDAMRRQADRIALPSRFSFRRDATLEARPSSPAPSSASF